MCQNQGEECCGGNCTCCPYGCSFTAPAILSILAMLVTWSATWSCYYIYVKFENNGGRQSDFYAGPWTVEDFDLFGGVAFNYGDCVGYNDHGTLDDGVIDTPMVFARAVIMIACFTALIFWIFLMCGGCMVLEPMLLKAMMPIFGFVAIFMMLSLVFLATEMCSDEVLGFNVTDCYLTGSGILAIVSFVLWIAAAATIPCMKEQVKDGSSPPPAAAAAAPAAAGTTSETVEQTIVEEDGTVTKVKTTTTVNPDGTRTVTETREVVKPSGDAPAAAAASPAEPDIPVADAKPVTY